jgi:thiamine biosynthesis lipoprotein
MSDAQQVTHRSTRPLMGTFVTVTVAHADAAIAEGLIDLAFDAMTAWCAEASEWEAEASVSRLSRAPVGELVALPDPLFRLLLLAQRVWHDSAGAFDPSWLPLKPLWPIRGQSLPPAPDAVAAALAEVGLDALQLLDGLPPTAVKRRAGLRLGLGAIAKGAAVDLACEALETAGATCFLIDAGGDIRGRDEGASWMVGVRDGRGGDLHSLLHLQRGAVATSGSYEAGFEHGGRRYHHLLDPRTGYPVPRLGGCTVIAPSCALADALATACFVLGPEAGRELLTRYPHAAAIWLDSDGAETATARWPAAESTVALPPATGFC